jgi:hypothetical protein
VPVRVWTVVPVSGSRGSETTSPRPGGHACLRGAAAGALVWQYAITGNPVTALGQLNTPGGFVLLLPDGSTPTHL